MAIQYLKWIISPQVNKNIPVISFAVSNNVRIFAPKIHEIMIKVYETKEEKKAAFMRSVGLRKVWEDLTSGKMSFEEFKRQGYNTINITK